MTAPPPPLPHPGEGVITDKKRQVTHLSLVVFLLLGLVAGAAPSGGHRSDLAQCRVRSRIATAYRYRSRNLFTYWLYSSL